MKMRLSINIWVGCVAAIVCSTSAAAQSTVTQVVTPTETITTDAPAITTIRPATVVAPGVTTIQTPTTVTKITTTPGHSVLTRSKDGSRIEMDSDNSVYVVYADGARAHAPDGILTLADGTTVTVKDGKRIP